jgi:type IV secretion system protein TrbI
MRGRDRHPAPAASAGEASATAEALELRTRPAPVTRINRKVLIGGAALALLVLATMVLIALKPPSLGSASRQELITADHTPISEGLAKLPASYDGLRPETKSGARDPKTLRPPPSERARLPASEPADDLPSAADLDKARLALGRAAESPIFFRLQLKGEAAEAQAQSPRAQGAAGRDDLPAMPPARAERAQVKFAGDGESPSADTGEAARKLSFLKSGPEKDIYNPHRVQDPVSPYQLMAGTVIGASLISGLNSDLPGFVIAQVTENVYDTVSGRHLLIPQGARIVGTYDNVVAFGQERALVVWQRIILPDGSSVIIDNLPATDTGGYAGLADEVDLHTWKLLKGVALATVLGVGSQLAVGPSSGSGGDSDLLKALEQSVQSTTNRAGQRLVERNLNVQPTITVRPGWPLRVIVHKDLVLRPYRGNRLH